MRFINKNWQKMVFLTFLFFSPIFSLYADTNTPIGDTGGKIINPISSTTIPAFIQTILEGALKIGIPVVALAIIYSGFLFVFARGNSEKLGKAKDALLYTIIGAAILLGSWAIAKLISATVLAL